MQLVLRHVDDIGTVSQCAFTAMGPVALQAAVRVVAVVNRAGTHQAPAFERGTK